MSIATSNKNMNKTIRYYLLFVCAALALPFGAYAQKPSKQAVVKGQVVDASNGFPLVYASVIIYSAIDSTLVKGIYTDDDGLFTTTLGTGRYYATIDYLSYEKKTLPFIVLHENLTLDLGEITLLGTSTHLTEVEVTGQISSVQLKPDKRIFIVGKDISNLGSSAAEILDNIPSVEVTTEGNVSLRNNENVQILVDGLPSHTGGLSSAEFLKQIPGETISSIEVVTNPSARYESEGSAGIINIVLKKEKEKGFNAAFSTSVGIPIDYGVAYNLNYKHRRINFFSNLGIDYRKSPGSTYQTQRFDGLNATYTYFSSKGEMSRGGFGKNMLLGIDLNLDKSNTLSASLSYRNLKGMDDTKTVYVDYTADGSPLARTVRANEEKDLLNNIDLTTSYSKTFELKDKKWTTIFKYINGADLEKADYVEQKDGCSPLLQRSSNTEGEATWLAQTDFVLPTANKGNMEMGLRASQRSINNQYKVESENQGTWTPLDAFTNHFKFQEGVYAAYFLYGQEKGKFSYQAGLRTEYAVTYAQMLGNEAKHRAYLDWFPSLHFSFKMAPSKQLQISYSRRLSRPRLYHLLPFVTFSDNRNIYSGNPDVTPEYTDAYEMSYLTYFNKGSVLASAYYRHADNEIMRIVELNNDGSRVWHPINLGTQDTYGLELNASFEAAKSWRFNGSINLFRSISAGNYKGKHYGSDSFSSNTRLNTKVSISKNTEIQASFNYRAPLNTVQGKQLSMNSLDAGITQEIFKGSASLVLSVADLFNCRKRRHTYQFDGYYSESGVQWRARQFLLAFNYRINGSDKKKTKSKEPVLESVGHDEGF